MKTLVLCRHAKSDWPAGVADINRPLKDRGIRNANFLGALLSERRFHPDRIISSPANRAVSTASIVAKALDYKDDIAIAPSIYHEGTASLFSFVRALPADLDTVMIFGHNPTMEMAVQSLLDSSAPFEMPTAAMACFECWDTDWQLLDSGNTQLRWYLVPRLQRRGH